MTHCAKCNLTPWRGRLCYQHSKEAAGFVFDTERKVFISTRKGRSVACRRKIKLELLRLFLCFRSKGAWIEESNGSIKLPSHETAYALPCRAFLIFPISHGHS